MALPSSPPITSEMIRLQYGGALPFNLRDYYRGGARVPNTAANSGVPTSGAISLLNFLGQGGSGGGGGALTATNSGAIGSQYVSEPAPPSLTVSADGNVSVTGGSGTYTCTWSHLSGTTSIPTPAVNVFSPSFSATVSKNSSRTAVKRCTVSDGLTSVNTDMTVTLEYFSTG